MIIIRDTCPEERIKMYKIFWCIVSHKWSKEQCNHVHCKRDTNNRREIDDRVILHEDGTFEVRNV